VHGKWQLVYALALPAGEVAPTGMARGRDGGLWIATSNGGVVHVHGGRTDVFASSDGLSGDHVLAFFEDREGSVWVATMDGLDRFREFAVATFSAKQGLSGNFVGSVLTARDGSIWLGTGGGLNQWAHVRGTTNRPTHGVPAIVPDPPGSICGPTL